METVGFQSLSLQRVRAKTPVFRQPEIVVGTWRAAHDQDDGIAEPETRDALLQLDLLWDELFPAEQTRIVQLLVERVDVGTDGLNVRLRTDGRGWCASSETTRGKRQDARGSLDPLGPRAVRNLEARRKLIITPEGGTGARGRASTARS